MTRLPRFTAQRSVPGGRREFAELIAWLTTGALDRDEPLWEAWRSTVWRAAGHIGGEI